MNTRVAKRYAQALFELAEQEYVTDLIQQDIHDFAELLDQHKLLRTLFYSIEEDEIDQQHIVDELLRGKTHVLLISFLKLLLQRRRQHALSDVVVDFDRLVDEKFNRVQVTVKTAIELDQHEIELLTQTLGHSLKSSVILKTIVDPELLGGMLLEIDNTRIDASLSRQLMEMKEQLGNAFKHA